MADQSPVAEFEKLCEHWLEASRPPTKTCPIFISVNYYFEFKIDFYLMLTVVPIYRRGKMAAIDVPLANQPLPTKLWLDPDDCIDRPAIDIWI